MKIKKATFSRIVTLTIGTSLMAASGCSAETQAEDPVKRVETKSVPAAIEPVAESTEIKQTIPEQVGKTGALAQEAAAGVVESGAVVAVAQKLAATAEIAKPVTDAIKATATTEPAVEASSEPSVPSMAGDAAAGAATYKKCRACHSIEAGKKKVGPSLYGVVGRTPGTLSGYKYSPAMIAYGQSGTTWDVAGLDTYLEAPRTMIPKIKMFFPGIKDQQTRLDLIAYLDSLDDH